jgi:hypothetical protein
MSEERRVDQVARSSVSEAGYVGLVKRRLGSGLRDPKLWKAEGGWEDKARVDQMMRGVEEKNERRRGEFWEVQGQCTSVHDACE